MKKARRTDNVVEITKSKTYGTWRSQRTWRPLRVVNARGCYFYDHDGNRYLDFSSQLICCNLGHKNRAVIDAICKQARRLPYIGPSFTCDIRAQLASMLSDILPRGLEKFFFTTSGTEANEAAIKIARLYTGKYKIISQYQSYHGSTAGSIALTGEFRRFYSEPVGKIDGVVFIPNVDSYRSPFGLGRKDSFTANVNLVEHIIRNEGNVAAIILEPISGTSGGVLVPPDDYLPALSEIAKKNNVLLIVDEVMTGWGRTGEWFAVNHWNVKPDILTTAKGITAAYTPLGLTATTKEIAEYFEDHYFAHGHTYEAHPLTLSAAVAAIGEYKRLDLISQARIKGEYLGQKLQQLSSNHACVGDIRGIGLFWGIELVKDRSSKAPFFDAEDKVAGKTSPLEMVSASMMRKRGVYVMNWLSHFLIGPPLTITKRQIDQGVAALDEGLSLLDKIIR